MTYAVHDFAAINRRLNRKPEPGAEPEGALANGGPVVGSPGCGPANVFKPDGSLAALRAEVEQMERGLEAYTRNKANG